MQPVRCLQVVAFPSDGIVLWSFAIELLPLSRSHLCGGAAGGFPVLVSVRQWSRQIEIWWKRMR
jgi:hypothetical protein